MRASWIKLLTVLTLCSASALGACAMDGAETSDDADSTTLTKDPLTGEDQFSIIMPNDISINLSIRQWQTDMNAFINDYGFCGPVLAVDGGFGTKTKAATVCFQTINGLQANADVGRITLGAMCAALSIVGETSLRNLTNCTQ
jgi:peptidoglycan hydrolase-like protein with peptidoglycan-binding domain